MMNTLPDHAALIKELKGPPAVAEYLGIGSINVRQWRSRKRIPPEHWSALIEMAARPDVNAQWFLETMPDRKPLTSGEQAREAA